jgi:hypothetical protein
MKKILCLTIVIGMMIIGIKESYAQVLDATIENGIGNIGQGNEFNYRNFSLDIAPISISEYHPTKLGLYGETNEIYFKDEANKSTGRFVQWHTGLTFNTKMGYDDSFFLRIRAGYGQSTTRIFGANDYNDKQRDHLIVASISFVSWQEESSWFSRHAVNVLYRQPLSSKKTATWQGNELISDSLPTRDNQLIRAYVTESPVSFFLDRNQDWKFNIDLSAGYGMETRLIDNSPKKIGYWMIGGGISIFKVPYYQQNLLQLGGEFQFMDQVRFVPSIRINLVPLIFLIWQKEEIEVKLND